MPEGMATLRHKNSLAEKNKQNAVNTAFSQE